MKDPHTLGSVLRSWYPLEYVGAASRSLSPEAPAPASDEGSSATRLKVRKKSALAGCHRYLALAPRTLSPQRLARCYHHYPGNNNDYYRRRIQFVSCLLVGDSHPVLRDQVPEAW